MLEWKPEHELGVPVLDEQHEVLFILSATLRAASAAGAPGSELFPMLEGIVAFLKFHFETEEQLMRNHGYPGFVDHKAIHDEITARADELLAINAEESGTCCLSAESLELIERWVAHHIDAHDRALAIYLTTRMDLSVVSK